MCVVCACMFICTPFVCMMPAEVRREHWSLKMESQMVMNHHVVLRTKPGSSVRAASSLNLWAIFPNLLTAFEKLNTVALSIITTL